MEERVLGAYSVLSAMKSDLESKWPAFATRRIRYFVVDKFLATIEENDTR